MELPDKIVSCKEKKCPIYCKGIIYFCKHAGDIYDDIKIT